jgi:hypothetical protein
MRAKNSCGISMQHIVESSVSKILAKECLRHLFSAQPRSKETFWRAFIQAVSSVSTLNSLNVIKNKRQQ